MELVLTHFEPLYVYELALGSLLFWQGDLEDAVLVGGFRCLDVDRNGWIDFLVISSINSHSIGYLVLKLLLTFLSTLTIMLKRIYVLTFIGFFV
jgi:hypothetical protein